LEVSKTNGPGGPDCDAADKTAADGHREPASTQRPGVEQSRSAGNGRSHVSEPAERGRIIGWPQSRNAKSGTNGQQETKEASPRKIIATGISSATLRRSDSPSASAANRAGASSDTVQTDSPLWNAFIAVDAASALLLDEIKAIPGDAIAILLRGESGAGKHAIASLIHCLDQRGDEPLLHLDCAATPAAMVEAELFGEERGPGPEDGGLRSIKRGRLEMAGEGTIVLEEVAALSMPVQARLGRAIDEKRFTPAGSGRAIALRARIIATTCVDLERAVARRNFREDLYYRLNVVSCRVPALRERPRDIGPLAEHFLSLLAEVHRRPRMRLSEGALRALQNYDYPGNVRELRDLMERAVLTCSTPELLSQDLPPHLLFPGSLVDTHRLSLDEMERAYIAEVLDYTEGRKSEAAGILGISRKTLLEKRKRYGLD
jgi:DNA-binding NtrC family response regulator